MSEEQVQASGFQSLMPEGILAVLGPIPSSVESDWKVHVDSVEGSGGSDQVQRVVLYIHNDEKQIYREVHLCHLDAGNGDQFVTVVYWEAGGGGTVVMPYVVVEGGLYVALAYQNRPCMGGMSWNAAGGYGKIAATHEDTGMEELHAEVGDHEGVFKRTWMVPGPRMNPQRSQWFSNFREGQGIGCLAVEVDIRFLKATDRGTLHLNVQTAQGGDGSDAEVIQGVEFFPYDAAVMMCPDMMVPAWAARIAVCLRDENIDDRMQDIYGWMLR